MNQKLLPEKYQEPQYAPGFLLLLSPSLQNTMIHRLWTLTELSTEQHLFGCSNFRYST